MKCPNCDGGGIMFAFGGGGYPCKNCNGTGQIEQTNEEWLKSLDTEGLVDHLYEVHKGGNTVERQAWIEKRKERVKMQIRGWLKAVHKE